MNKSEVVKNIIDGKIVAFFQGDSEWGLRALEIVNIDPKILTQKTLLIKLRKKWYRPFAGTILLEYVNDYFEMLTIKESPYISYAIPDQTKAKDE